MSVPYKRTTHNNLSDKFTKAFNAETNSNSVETCLIKSEGFEGPTTDNLDIQIRI